jgi:hypothetical protein
MGAVSAQTADASMLTHHLQRQLNVTSEQPTIVNNNPTSSYRNRLLIDDHYV